MMLCTKLIDIGAVVLSKKAKLSYVYRQTNGRTDIHTDERLIKYDNKSVLELSAQVNKNRTFIRNPLTNPNSYLHTCISNKCDHSHWTFQVHDLFPL